MTLNFGTQPHCMVIYFLDHLIKGTDDGPADDILDKGEVTSGTCKFFRSTPGNCLTS